MPFELKRAHTIDQETNHINGNTPPQVKVEIDKISVHVESPNQVNIFSESVSIEFELLVTIVIIPDVLVTHLIAKLYKSCLIAMASQTMLAGMKFSINGTPNSHEWSNFQSVKSSVHNLQVGRLIKNKTEMQFSLIPSALKIGTLITLPSMKSTEH